MAFDHEFRGTPPAEANDDAPRSTTMNRLVHDDPDCGYWTEREPWTLKLDDELLALYNGEGVRYGDWDGDEAPNCPDCGENLYIEVDGGDYIEPKVWFEQVEVTECDGCGEIKAVDDGTLYRDAVHAAMIDPPDEHWICNACEARAEQHDEDRMMEAERPWTTREQYIYGK